MYNLCVFSPDFSLRANIADRLKTIQGILSCMNSPLALAKTCSSDFHAVFSLPSHAHRPDGNYRACPGYGLWGALDAVRAPGLVSSKCCMLSVAVKIRPAWHALATNPRFPS